MAGTPLTDHRRQRLNEALLAARGAVSALERGIKEADAESLAVAGAALADVGSLASRYARALEGVAPIQPARQLSPRGGPRRSVAEAAR